MTWLPLPLPSLSRLGVKRVTPAASDGECSPGHPAEFTPRSLGRWPSRVTLVVDRGAPVTASRCPCRRISMRVISCQPKLRGGLLRPAPGVSRPDQSTLQRVPREATAVGQVDGPSRCGRILCHCAVADAYPLPYRLVLRQEPADNGDSFARWLDRCDKAVHAG